jgi:hypothetical protein
VRLRPLLAGVAGASALTAGVALDLAEVFLVGLGVAGGLDTCVISDFKFASGSGAVAFVAADLVVRAIVAICRGCCWAGLNKQRVDLLCVVNERDGAACRHVKQLTLYTLTIERRQMSLNTIARDRVQ